MKKKRAKARPKKDYRSNKIMVRGIEYDSAFEGEMALLLHSGDIEFNAHHTFLLFNKATYKSPVFLRAQRRSKFLKDNRKMDERVYTPDFVDPQLRWVIETKGYKTPSFNLRWRIFLEVMNLQGCPPMLFMPRQSSDNIQTFDIIKKEFYS